MTSLSSPYRILDRQRRGEALTQDEIRQVVAGVVDGSWSDAQLGAFLMASAVRGLDDEETRALTIAMLESGTRWQLRKDFPSVGDKHSTGGVGDKVSLVLAPIVAACNRPVAMLTGRGLGHTGGTADKLETIPGLDLSLDRQRCVRLLASCGMAVGIATDEIAPADRRLYALRDQTGTVVSIPLITASILSKKLATGAAGVVFDVKSGSGAFLADTRDAADLARRLVGTAEALGTPASALVTDMSQPLGRWAGNSAEVWETVQCLEGEGPSDLMEVVYRLCEEVARLVGEPLTREELEDAVGSGRARDQLARWVEAQGGEARSLETPPELAPEVIVARAETAGFLGGVETRRLGLLLAESGGGRVRQGDVIDAGVALETLSRLGQRVEKGDDLARLHVRRRDERIAQELEQCFRVDAESPEVPTLVGAAF